jgi:hypothetical protein
MVSKESVSWGLSEEMKGSFTMLRHHLWALAFGLLLAGPAAGGQGSTLASSEARAFIGTWVFAMTEPKGAQETVRITDKVGQIAATVQAQQFPPIEVSDVAKIGENLILRATRFENGKPIEALVILKLNGGTMNMIQELEGSVVTKRGSGKQQ